MILAPILQARQLVTRNTGDEFQVEASQSSEPDVFLPELSILSKFDRLAGNTHLEASCEQGIMYANSFHGMVQQRLEFQGFAEPFLIMLQLMGCVVVQVDAELTRGISLRESLHNFGSLWRQSPTHMDREDSLCATVGNSELL